MPGSSTALSTRGEITSLGPSRRIVLATFGSQGDVNPFLSLGIELQRRGHHCTIATSECYRQRVTAAGLDFCSMRPDLPTEASDPGVYRKLMHSRTGTEFMIRKLLLPCLKDAYEDLAAAAAGAHLVVSHPTAFAAPLVAEEQGIRWVSTVLSPLSFLSTSDTLALSQAPLFAQIRKLGPSVLRPLRALAVRHSLSWFKPIFELRADLGLSQAGNPVFDGQHSPHLVLALFSKVLGRPQPDWPRQARVTGFIFNDPTMVPEIDPRLEEFLEDGPPPIIFTLGTLACCDSGDFFTRSAEAAARMGQRALLLVGSSPERDAVLHRRELLPPGVAAFRYAPFSTVFPRAAAVVHQGGIGTVGQSLRAGIPMLILPFAHDQADNAARVLRLGAGRVIDRGHYSADRVTRELSILLQDPSYATAAAKAGAEIRRENGLQSACAALEEQLSLVTN